MEGMIMEYKYVCSLSGHDIPNDLQYSIPVTVDIPESVTRDEIIRQSCLGTSVRVRIAIKMGKQPKECPKWAMFGYKTSWDEVYAKTTKPTKPVDNMLALDLVDFVDLIMEQYPKECDGSPTMAVGIYAEKHKRPMKEVMDEYKELTQ
jgi:hypothetical protein